MAFSSLPPAALARLLDTVPCAVGYVSKAGVWQYVNSVGESILGLTQRQIVGQPLAAAFSRTALGRLEGMVEQALRCGSATTYDAPMPLPDNREHKRWLRIQVTPDHDGDGHVCGVYLVSTDIDDIVRSQRKAQAQQELITQHLDHGIVAFLQLGPDFRIERWSGAMQRMLGWTAQEAIGKSAEELATIHPDDRESVAQATRKVLEREAHVRTYLRSRNVTKEGRVIWCDWYGTRVPNQETGHISILLFAVDVTERVEARRTLTEIAWVDSLTQLPNRHSLFQWLQVTLARPDISGSVLFIDLDGFKEVNDRYGHEVGDALLVAVAQRLRDSADDVAYLARHGGDEFVAFHTAHSQEDARLVANRITSALRRPFSVQNLSIDLSCSLGIALVPEHGRDAHALVKAADLAMYHAKFNGRDQHAFFTQALGEAQLRRTTLYSGLRDALRGNRIEVYFQPRVRVSDDTICGAEALVRWQDADGAFIAPTEFIPVAEESGLIHELGAYVMRQAFTIATQLNAGRPADAPVVCVSVNVSGVQLRYERFVEQVEVLLELTACQGEWVEIEVTESRAVVETILVERLRDLSSRVGVRCSLDDFGTGYSNLGELSQLPIRAVKIDQSFVHKLSARNEAVVVAIIALARSLRLDVIAEGVETQEQLVALRRLGCDTYQGFLHSEPMPEARFLERVRADVHPR